MSVLHEPAEAQTQRVNLAMCFIFPIKHLDVIITGETGTKGRLGHSVALRRACLKCLRINSKRY